MNEDELIQLQLRGFDIWAHVFTGIACYRDTVERKHGIRFEIRPKEQGHNVPHCHACFGNQNISISLIDCTVLAGNIPPQKQRAAVMWVEANLEVLQEHWDKFHVLEV